MNSSYVVYIDAIR